MLDKFINFLGIIILLVEIIILIFIRNKLSTKTIKYHLIILLALLGIVAYISLVMYLTKEGKITL